MTTSLISRPSDYRDAPAPGRSVLRAHDLVKTYGSGSSQVVALDGCSVELRQGEFTAIMGPSGSGKSTLLHCLAALDRPTSGTVWLGGTELTPLDDNALTDLRRDRVGFVFQAFNLVPTLTAEENIRLPLELAGVRCDPPWIDRLVEAVGLTERRDHFPTQLSGGQQQRVACARALVARPDVVFADEPTGSLDSRAGAAVLDLLRRTVDEDGQSVVMVTHDPLAAARCDRVVFLVDGQVVDEMLHPTAEGVLDWMGAAASPEGR